MQRLTVRTCIFWKRGRHMVAATKSLYTSAASWRSGIVTRPLRSSRQSKVHVMHARVSPTHISHTQSNMWSGRLNRATFVSLLPRGWSMGLVALQTSQASLRIDDPKSYELRPARLVPLVWGTKVRSENDAIFSRPQRWLVLPPVAVVLLQ